MTIYTYSPYGILGSLVKVEIDIRRGIPVVDIVGLPDHSVKEAKARIKVAFAQSGLEYPKQRVLLNLSPADQKKKGSGIDLALALAIVSAMVRLESQEPSEMDPGPVFTYGELGLDGSVKQTAGLEAGILAALEQGIRRMILPRGLSPQAFCPSQRRTSADRQPQPGSRKPLLKATEHTFQGDSGGIAQSLAGGNPSQRQGETADTVFFSWKTSHDAPGPSRSGENHSGQGDPSPTPNLAEP
jgi:hypothetical protein